MEETNIFDSKCPIDLRTHFSSEHNEKIPGATQEEQMSYVKALAITHFSPFADLTPDQIQESVVGHNKSGATIVLLKGGDNKVVYRRNRRDHVIPGVEFSMFFVGKFLTTLDHLNNLEGFKPQLFYLSEEKTDMLFEFIEGDCLNKKPELFNFEVAKQCVKGLAKYSNLFKGVSYSKDNVFVKHLKSGIIHFSNSVFSFIQSNIPEELKQIRNTVLEKIQDNEISKKLFALNRENCCFTMNHCDAHKMNVLIDQETKECTWVDFETTSDQPLGYDLAYFLLFASMKFNQAGNFFEFTPNKWFNEDERDILLKEYLNEIDVTDFDQSLCTFEKVKKDLYILMKLVIHIWYTVILMIISTGRDNLNPQKQFEEISKVAKFIDLNMN